MSISRAQMTKQLTGGRMIDEPKKTYRVDSTGDDQRDMMEVRAKQERLAPDRSFVAKMSSGGKPKKSKSRVNEAGNYTKPGMRKRLFNRIKAGGKGGSPGQWSARKAQMLASAYKKAGGGYKN